MSDTATAETTNTDPNFSVQDTELKIDGKSVSCMKVTFGPQPRNLMFRKLTLGDDLDLIGVAGDLSDNQKWMLLARMAWGAVEVDGVPTPGAPRTSQEIKARLDQIGTDGLSAYLKGVGTLAKGEDDIMAAAKN